MTDSSERAILITSEGEMVLEFWPDVAPGHVENFKKLAKQGFYSLILPGGLIGLGAGLGRGLSWWVSVLCGLLGLCAGLFTQWHLFPFVADRSAGYFLTHLHHLKPLTLLMLGAGTVIAFWVPFRRQKV